MKHNWKIGVLVMLLSLLTIFGNDNGARGYTEEQSKERHIFTIQEQSRESAIDNFLLIVLLLSPVIISLFIYWKRKKQMKLAEKKVKVPVSEEKSLSHVTLVLEVMLVLLLMLFAWGGYILFSKQPVEVNILQEAAEEAHDHSVSGERMDMEAHDDHAPVKSDSSIYFKRPKEINVGERTGLTFMVKDKDGNTVTDLQRHHARMFHVVIVSEDMNILGHIHPEDFPENAKEDLVVYFTFPKAGKYVIGLNAMDTRGMISRQFIINAMGKPKMEGVQEGLSTRRSFPSYALGENDRYTDAVTIDGGRGDYDVSIAMPYAIVAEEEATIVYNFKKDGHEVQDFVPYLDAPLHAAVVSSELDTFVHEHGDVVDYAHGATPETFGPNLELRVTFPNPGMYTIFTQAKHQQRMVVTKFMVEAKSRN